jgi:hypothetical protein
MVWCWSPEEDQAMDYLPHAAQVLYLRVLRRRMDYATCIVGLTVRLSYQLIGEWLEVRPPAMSRKPLVRLTVSEIRAALVQLERAGLIQRVFERGEALPLVFLLPLAKAGLVREKFARQDEQQQNPFCTTANPHADESLIGELFSSNISKTCELKVVVDNSQKSASKNPMNDSKNADEQQDEQQTSSKSSLSINNKYISHARGNGGLVPKDWLPSVEIVRQLVAQYDLPPAFLKLKALEFRVMWNDQGQIAENWDFYFVGACRNRIAQGDADFLTAIAQRKQQ